MRHTPLNEEQVARRALWVQDLVSGEYRQGHSVLKKIIDGEPHHCCLGVAAERLCPRSFALRIPKNDTWSTGGNLPRAASRLLGLGDTADLGTDQNVAITWNDGRSLTFTQIADRIAYATKHNLTFDEVAGQAPRDYALTWLEERRAS